MDIVKAYQIIDTKFTIEENKNYPKGMGNLFLMSGGRCVGGANRDLDGDWYVTVHVPYDPEIGSDALLVGTAQDQAAARRILWANRHKGHTGTN